MGPQPLGEQSIDYNVKIMLEENYSVLYCSDM